MAAFQSITTSFDHASAEDLMEVYPGGEDDPADGDGIDIDLDLTTDHPENIDDDEMIEDPDADVEDINPGTGLVQDEQMMDGGENDRQAHSTVEDVYQELYDELDDVDPPEMKDQSYVAVDAAEQNPQLSESNLHALPPDTQPLDSRDQDHLDDNSRDTWTRNLHILPDISLSSMDGNSAAEVPTAQDFLMANPAGPLDRPAILGDEPHSTPDHVDHHKHTARTPSRGVMSGSQNPLTSAEEKNTPLGRAPSVASGSVGETIEGSEQHVRTTAGTLVGHGRPTPDSQRTGSSLQDDLPKTSPMKEGNGYKTHLDTSDHSSLPGTDVFQVSEDNSDQPIASGANISRETQSAHEISHVHPVTVKYQDREMYLFPPTEEQKDYDKFFLSDEGLAAEGIRSLFGGFRDFLGESIGDMEELEIKFDDLDLCISESNIDTANITLVHILDIYCQLHYNESNDTPKSMHLTLSTNPRFADKLNYLEDLVTEGVGLSQLAYENSSSDNRSPGLPIMRDEIPALETPIESANVPVAGTNDRPAEPMAKHTLTDTPANESTNTHGLLSNGAAELAGNDLPTSGATDSGDATDVTSKGAVVETVAMSHTSYTFDPSIQQDSGKSTSLSIPQSSDAADEDFNEEEYYEEEGEFDIEENADTNEEQSAGSSTVQGDDANILKAEIEKPSGVSLFDEPLAETHQQHQQPSKPDKTLDAEDVISYETDEEDYAEDAEDAENDIQWQDNDGADLVSPEFPGSEPAALHDTNGKSVYEKDLASDALENPDAGVRGPGANDVDYDRFGKDQNIEANELENLQQATGERDAVVEDAQSFSTDAAVVPTGLSAHMNLHSAKDDDEITFDDEGEEEAQDVSVASTGPAVHQSARSSPDSLKRAREIDEIIDVENVQSK
ncbi:MAG: hypothetical protein Q9171_000354 [Xanthocarpia ochracea]